MDKFLQKHPVSIFRAKCACAELKWVLLITKKNLRIAGFFASLPFSNDLTEVFLRYRFGGLIFGGANFGIYGICFEAFVFVMF